MESIGRVSLFRGRPEVVDAVAFNRVLTTPQLPLVAPDPSIALLLSPSSRVLTKECASHIQTILSGGHLHV